MEVKRRNNNIEDIFISNNYLSNFICKSCEVEINKIVIELIKSSEIKCKNERQNKLLTEKISHDKEEERLKQIEINYPTYKTITGHIKDS